MLVDGVMVAVVLVSTMRLILTMVVTMVIALTVMVQITIRMVPGTVLVHPRLADPPGCVLGEADPVRVVRHPGEDPRQSRLARGGWSGVTSLVLNNKHHLAALRPVGHQPDELRPRPLAVGDQGRARVPGTRAPEVLTDDAHLTRTHLLLALSEVVLLHAHRG